MGAIINLLEKVNTLVYKKVPYQAYVFLSFIMIAVVAQYVYDYNTQPKDLTDWSKIKIAELEPNIMEGSKMEGQVYQGPVRPTDDIEYFRATGITKPLEVKN